MLYIFKNINNFFRNIRYSLYIYFINKNIIKINLSPLENNLLTKLMNKYGSDKGNINNKHNYTKFYESLFSDIKNKKINFMEVGLGSVDTNISFHMKFMGNDYKPLASLYAWHEYFKNSNIYGADIDKSLVKNIDRIKTFYVDMMDEKSIIDMWKSINTKMDIIIDDGFHSYEANINLFKNSFKHLNISGYYIIEDVHRKPSNIKKFNNFFIERNINFQIIDIPHLNNVNDNCLIFIKKN